jgi:hypothetical protein
MDIELLHIIIYYHSYMFHHARQSGFASGHIDFGQKLEVFTIKLQVSPFSRLWMITANRFYRVLC